ncbi:MAG: hypothetical protein CBD16_00060 [Betaproteobacteria bacterium TMED156]|nr:MAG: hypothetical protein CBD16_00060 [Betaproteobacteria bacterium TMED156]|tara:strand:- start:1399 stop:1584 length:186 start_codon:yes stop_codon:yes gene_type:complete
MTIKNIADKIINDALNSEQYFQCLINGSSKSQALKLVIDEMKQNGVFEKYVNQQKKERKLK